MIDIVLPYPPTVNTYWRMWQGRMVISTKGRDYRKVVAEQIIIQNKACNFKCKLRVEIEAFRPDNRRRDLDNILKATLDALAHASVYEDDAQIIDLRIFWSPQIGGMLKVKVEEIHE